MNLEQLQALQSKVAAARASIQKQKARFHDHIWQRHYDTPLDFITNGLRQLNEPSWWPWRVVLKAAYALPLDDRERDFFHAISGGRSLPKHRVKELWCIVGRRGGKDSIASLIALEAARLADDAVMLRPGESVIVALLATDRDQAGVAFNYTKGYFEEYPELRTWLAGDLPNSFRSGPIKLRNRVEIRVTTNNFRAPRGRPVACAVLDECAFYRSEDSAAPDFETYAALRPAMLTVPRSILVGITSPHKESGLAFQKYDDHFGKDSDDVLVIQAETRQMNPLIEELFPGEIEQAIQDDPERASAEYLAQFRKDLADYVAREVVQGALMRGVYEISPQRNVQYVAFVDPSGGARDSFTLAISHFDLKADKAVLDCLREWRAPFSPEAVVQEIADVCKTYNVVRVRGDRYAAEWPVEAFAKVGIIYEQSDAVKNDIYRDFLPFLNSGRARLVDSTRLVTQLCSLERRTVRGGKDSIDHPRGGRDDLANAAAGSLLMAAGDERSIVVRRYLGVG